MTEPDLSRPDLSRIGGDDFTWPVHPLLGQRIRHGILMEILRLAVTCPDRVHGLLFARKALSIEVANRLLLAHLSATTGVPLSSDPESAGALEALFISRDHRARPGKAWLAWHGQALALRLLDGLGITRPLLRLQDGPVPEELRSRWSYRIRNPYAFLGHAMPLDAEERRAIASLAREFSHWIVERYVPDTMPDAARVRAMLEREFELVWGDALTTAAMDYHTLQQVLRYRPVDGFLGSLGGYVASLLALAIREHGGHLSTSIHAAFDFRVSNGSDLMELVLANRFYCLTREAAERVERLAERVWGASWRQAYGVTCALRWWWPDGWLPAPVPERATGTGQVTTVMVMGMLAHPRWTHGPMALPVQLDLEQRVCRLLTGAGYQVIYKAHPESTWRQHAELFGPAVQVEWQPFERVWQDADAFVVLHAQSTTVQTIIFPGDRPVVFLWHPEMDPYEAASHPELTERCHIVPVDVDGNNRCRFEPERLLQALAAPGAVSRALRQQFSR
jgi:hypothetical protein